MRSDRLYFVISLVALLVLGAAAVSLSPAYRGSLGTSEAFTPAPSRPGASVTAVDTSNQTPTVATQPFATPVDGRSTLVALPTSPAELTAVGVVTVTSTLPSPEQPPAQPDSVAQPVIQPEPVNLPTPIPIPPSAPERVGGPVPVPNNHPGPRWVTLQAGHLRNENLPGELRHLLTNTGAFAAGVSEVELNEAVAQKSAQRLIERGYKVELLDATVPVGYTTDLFLAIHADGNVYSSVRGFKAIAPWNSVPASDDFVGFLYEEYGKATGLPTDPMTSVAMANYYAFNPWRYLHAVTPDVPSALLEMGFVTNPEDRKVLTLQQDAIAWGIANAVDRYFRSGKAGPIPTAYPSFTPTDTPTSTPTNTPTVTSTSTPTPTSTSVPTDTPTPVPTELAVDATETAILTTPVTPTPTAVLPQPTATTVPSKTPVPTPTPLQGIVTEDGRWLPPLSPSAMRLPQPGSSAPPVLIGTDTENIRLRANGREQEQVWQQLYIPDLGRSVWRKAILRQVRH